MLGLHSPVATQIIPETEEVSLMAKNEKSSVKLASLAGKVLQQKSSSATDKRLAGSVLTQAPDKKPAPKPSASKKK